VGGVIKRMLAINPDLSAGQIIDFIKQSALLQSELGIQGELAQAEVIDEAKALELARATLPERRGKLTLVRSPRG
jgi:hypothetical protein